MSRAQFGAYTRNLRTDAGLSQLEVAKSLGLKSGQLVSNWERGTCYPPIESFQELAALYRVNLRTFFNKYWDHVKEDDWKKVRGLAPNGSSGVSASRVCRTRSR